MPTPKICSIPDCGKPAVARGWCARHYARWSKHGEPQAGKSGTLHGEPMAYFERVMMEHFGEECLMWPFSSGGKGYATFWLGHRQVSVTREICRRLYGDPPSALHEAAHSCGNGKRGCVTRAHLRWATPKENAADKVFHGTKLLGSQLKYAKLTESQVVEIAAMRGQARVVDLAVTYHVTKEAIYRIWQGRNWSWLTGIEAAPSSAELPASQC